MENFTLYSDMSEKNDPKEPPISGQRRRKIPDRESTLLVVDSEILLAEQLCRSLAVHNFVATVVHSAAAAWEAIGTSTFDLIMLDATLAEGEEAGFELAQRVRDGGYRQPILFLTARNKLADRIRAYEYGDDYLSKPFDLAELVAKLEALSRRGLLPPRTITWRELTLSTAERTVHRNGKLITLTAVEYQLVELFMLNPNKLFSYNEIFERIWGAGSTSRSNNLNVHIKNIRTKVGDKNFFETVRGVGYRLPW